MAAVQTRHSEPGRRHHRSLGVVHAILPNFSRRLILGLIIKVIVEDDEIIILLHEVAQAEVLCQEVEVFEARAIVRQLVWVDVFTGQYLFKQAPAVTAALDSLMNVKVKDA